MKRQTEGSDEPTGQSMFLSLTSVFSYCTLEMKIEAVLRRPNVSAIIASCIDT